MTTNGNGEERISFTVKELVVDLGRKVDAVVAMLSAKADEADLLRLQSKVTELELGGSRNARETALRVEALAGRLALVENLDTPFLRMTLGELRTNTTNHEERLRVLEGAQLRRSAALTTANKIWLTVASLVGIATPIITVLVVARH